MTLAKRELKMLDDALAETMDKISSDVRLRVRKMEGLASLRKRADGDTTHAFDRFAEDRILEVLERSGIPMVVRTEESGVVELGNNPALVVILIST